MATYERITAAGVREVLRRAQELLPTRIPLEVTKQDHHSITLAGGDGTVTISGHRHGLDTTVHAATDQLRTSRLDVETQYFLNALPYQPEDVLYQPGDRSAL